MAPLCFALTTAIAHPRLHRSWKGARWISACNVHAGDSVAVRQSNRIAAICVGLLMNPSIQSLDDRQRFFSPTSLCFFDHVQQLTYGALFSRDLGVVRTTAPPSRMPCQPSATHGATFTVRRKQAPAASARSNPPSLCRRFFANALPALWLCLTCLLMTPGLTFEHGDAKAI